MTADYVAAIKLLAETGEESPILFERLSDADASALAWKASTDKAFARAVTAAQKKSGMVDTFVLLAANQ